MKTLFSKPQLSKIKNKAFTDEQLLLLFKPTPKNEIEYKEDDDGVKYKTVKGSYMKKQLNLIFGWNWDFQILSKDIYQSSGEVLVHGKLTIRSSKFTVVKEQFGKHNISYSSKSSGNRNVSAPSGIGNAFKSAATDAFKKCASEIGLCWDIYSQEKPEPDNKKENKETYQQQKITERFKHFLKGCNNNAELEDIIQRFKDSNEVTEIHEELIKEYRSKFQ